MYELKNAQRRIWDLSRLGMIGRGLFSRQQLIGQGRGVMVSGPAARPPEDEPRPLIPKFAQRALG